jgi:hypothetical protein
VHRRPKPSTSLAASVASAVFISASLWRRRGPQQRDLWHPAVLNVVSRELALGAAELAVRLLWVRTPAGMAVGGTTLTPKRWEDVVVGIRELLVTAAPSRAYFVPDEFLGWTVWRSHRSANGPYSPLRRLRFPPVPLPGKGQAKTKAIGGAAKVVE